MKNIIILLLILITTIKINALVISEHLNNSISDPRNPIKKFSKLQESILKKLNELKLFQSFPQKLIYLIASFTPEYNDKDTLELFKELFDSSLTDEKIKKITNLITYANLNAYCSEFSILDLAIGFYNLELIKILLNAGINLHNKNRAFIQAIIYRFSLNLSKKKNLNLLKIIELLLENGADPNTTFEDDEEVLPALILASKKPDFEIIKLLLMHDADTDVKSLIKANPTDSFWFYGPSFRDIVEANVNKA